MRDRAIASNFRGSKPSRVGRRPPHEIAVRLGKHLQKAHTRVAVSGNFEALAVEFRIFGMDHRAHDYHHDVTAEMRNIALLADMDCGKPLGTGRLAHRGSGGQQTQSDAKSRLFCPSSSQWNYSPISHCNVSGNRPAFSGKTWIYYPARL